MTRFPAPDAALGAEDAAARRSLPFKNWRGRDVWGHSALNPTPKQVEGIALRCPRPGGRNEWEKDTRFATRFSAPGAALGAGDAAARRSLPFKNWRGRDVCGRPFWKLSCPKVCADGSDKVDFCPIQNIFSPFRNISLAPPYR